MGPSSTIALTASSITPSTTPSAPPAHPSLPPRPSYDFAAKADSIGLGATPTAQSIQHLPAAAQALAGSNRDIVANRRAIRMANLSAAEVLRAEISGANSVSHVRSLPSKPVSAPPPDLVPNVTLEASPMSITPVRTHTSFKPFDDSDDVPGLRDHRPSDIAMPPASTESALPEDDADADGEPDTDTRSIDGSVSDTVEHPSHGIKRKFEEGPAAPDDVDDVVAIEEEEEAPPDAPLPLKVNADGTVEQEDTVKFVTCFFLLQDLSMLQAMGTRIQRKILSAEVLR